MGKKLSLFLLGIVIVSVMMSVIFGFSAFAAPTVYNPDFQVNSVQIKNNGKYVRFTTKFNQQNTDGIKNILKYIVLPFNVTLYGDNVPEAGLVLRDTTVKGSTVNFAFDFLKQANIKPCSTYSVKISLGKSSYSPQTPQSVLNSYKIEEIATANNQIFGYFHTNQNNFIKQDLDSNGSLLAECPKLFGMPDLETPDSAIIVAGTNNNVMAKYRFYAEDEAFILKKIDVVIDDNYDFVDDSSDEGSANIEKVSLSYPTQNGLTETVSASMISGKASFTNLNFYIPKEDNALITILADINTIENGAVSGASFRLGFPVTNNTFNFGLFEALGTASGQTQTTYKPMIFVQYPPVKKMVVRKSMPIVELQSPGTYYGTDGDKLKNGSNNLAAIRISADDNGDVAFKKLSFGFLSAGSIDVYGLELYRKLSNGTEENITDDVSIKDKTGQDLKVGGSKLITAGNKSNDVSIIWNEEALISKGTASTYILRATVENASFGDSVGIFMPMDMAPFAGQIAITDYFSALSDLYYFIWSDISAENHSVFTSDWTNAFLVPGAGVVYLFWLQ